MITHERHRGRGHAAARGRTVAVFNHPPRQGSEQQVKEIITVAAHQRAGQQQGLASLRRQHAHGLALGAAAVLVLMRFVRDEQVERALRKIPLDELRRLVAALAEAELHVGHRTFHARGLTVGKHQLAVAIHEVDELVDVVAQHRGQEAVTELLHQLLRGDFPDSRDALQGFEDSRGLVTAGQASRTDQRPQGRGAMAALPAVLLGFECDRVDRLAVKVGDDSAAVRAGRHVTVAGAPPGEDRLPMEPHPHPYTTQNEKLLTRGLHPQLLAQLDELDQCVRAVEHPDLGARHRLLDLASPLVNQVWRRKHQGAAVAFGVEDGGRGDADGRLAAPHLAIDDRGAFTTIDQQLGGGMDDFGLGFKQLAFEAGDDELAVRLWLAGIDRRVGPIERVEQFVAELTDEILKAQGQRRRFRVEQFALRGCSFCGSRFKIEGHGDAPKKNGACTTPSGAMACPVVGRRIGARPTMVESAGLGGPLAKRAQSSDGSTMRVKWRSASVTMRILSSGWTR
ncbi:hypothetical protein AVE30378_06155 [Achromobacter veterisilvae]|uniref:Uncharacterized protein n=1 Tax=Achromobacter veterisilvae TaxID=2069367 RepID=A0A446D116_9BURK|nr:hypothetical protein AVE30378_06155 [Achromobacter veterisilvae]